MRFLVSASGDIGDAFGVLTTPAHGHVHASIKEGLPFAVDNEAYTRGFDPERFFPFLESLEPYRDRCLFVTVPDVVGDCAATLALFARWRPVFGKWPLAYVAQDGSERKPFPTGISALFVGGSTVWKLSGQADAVIRRAQHQGLHVHIGRVNWWRRYHHFRSLPGSDTFTCDGTRQRFEGIENTLSAWLDYEHRPYSIRMIL